MRVGVVLSPSLFLDQRLWTRVVPLLPATYALRFADRPALDGIIDPAAAIAACEAAALEHVEVLAEVAPIVVVGVSFGGYLAARLALASSRVQHIVAISSVAAIPGEFAATYRQTADALERGDLGLHELKAALLAPVVAPHERDAGMDRLIQEMLDGVDLPTALLTLRMNAVLSDPALSVAPFRTPATVVHAREDRIVPLSWGEELAARGENASLIVLESSSHLLPLTHPAELAQIIGRVVEKLAG